MVDFYGKCGEIYQSHDGLFGSWSQKVVYIVYTVHSYAAVAQV